MRSVGRARRRQSHGFIDRGRDADNLDPLALEQLACCREEMRAVVYKKRAHGHAD